MSTSSRTQGREWTCAGQQFGLRSLLLIVAVFGAQLAIWRSGWGCQVFALYIIAYVCLSLLATLAIGLHHLGCLLFGRGDLLYPNRVFYSRWGQYFRWGNGLFCFSFLLTAGWLVAVYNVTQHRLETRLQQELGFTYRKESHALQSAGGLLADYAAVEIVEQGGALDRAGFQPDDIILYENPPPLLFQMLTRRRGETVQLTAIRPTASQPLLEKCPRLVLTLELPP